MRDGDMVKEHTRSLLTETPIPKAMAWILISLGVAIIVGGQGRMSGRSFQAAVAICRGNVWIWGLVILVGGAVLLYGVQQHVTAFRVAGYFISAAWFGFFAATFAYQAYQDSRAAFTGVVLYSGFAVLLVLMARISRARR